MKTRPVTHYVVSSKRSAATVRRMKEARAKALAAAREQSHTAPCCHSATAEEKDREG